MSLYSTINYRAYDARLDCAAWNTYSQFGEDGLVNRVFNEIGATNHWCFEVGAHDGKFFSNTLRLRENGWKAVLIESDAEHYRQLNAEYASEQVHCVHEHAVSLDSILGRYEVPEDLDFGVIDIDGQDYWLWHDMLRYRPRVMLVEFHDKYGEWFRLPRDRECDKQAGRESVKQLGLKKGYLAVAETYCNLLFVLGTAWGRLCP